MTRPSWRSSNARKRRVSVSDQFISPKQHAIDRFEIKECLLEIIQNVIASADEDNDDVFFENPEILDSVKSNMDIFEAMDQVEMDESELETLCQKCETNMVKNLPKRGETGNNTGVRNFGSSERTLWRKKSKQRKRHESSIDHSQKIYNFFNPLPRAAVESLSSR
jgi:hypothetical protein